MVGHTVITNTLVLVTSGLRQPAPPYYLDAIIKILEKFFAFVWWGERGGKKEGKATRI
jgi:hypothetical protein